MSKANTYNVIGLMSGTSLDGLDMAYCEFSYQVGNWQYKIHLAESIAYKEEQKEMLKNSFYGSDDELVKLDRQYGSWLGKTVSEFIQVNKLAVDLIASHGHTVRHQPSKGITFQIGSGQEIADTTGTRTVSDFRKLDVSLGGQGAPLVPIGDELLFSSYEACINLGGIANISYREKNKRVAFDIGMANMPLNLLSGELGEDFDRHGEMARSGKVDTQLLEQLNRLEYFDRALPKSLGFEWFLANFKPLLDHSKASIQNKLATVVDHEAYQIGQALKSIAATAGSVLITGGGALNDYLIERIKFYTPENLELIIPERKLIDFKEALIFAFMGVLRIREESNCLCSVTGALRDSSAGEVFIPSRN